LPARVSAAPANGSAGKSVVGPGPDAANAAAGVAANPHRRSLLELAPLELACMNTLWPLGEGTVRQIRDALAPTRPRAYTTIMTIMDRLARKGAIERRKSGRSYVYRPALTAQEARTRALNQLVECFFGGSPAAMLAEVHRHWGIHVPR
jgi:BlaI family transcriptional regulator, penicillinase repressor